MNILKHKFSGSEWLNLVRDLLTMTFDTDKDYELIIRDYKEKRSLQANNYSWVLTDKLAEKMLIAGARYSKEEMHAEMILRWFLMISKPFSKRRKPTDVVHNTYQSADDSYIYFYFTTTIYKS